MWTSIDYWRFLAAIIVLSFVLERALDVFFESKLKGRWGLTMTVDEADAVQEMLGECAAPSAGAEHQ